MWCIPLKIDISDSIHYMCVRVFVCVSVSGVYTRQRTTATQIVHVHVNIIRLSLCFAPHSELSMATDATFYCVLYTKHIHSYVNLNDSGSRVFV